jgi:hypothetical protein
VPIKKLAKVSTFSFFRVLSPSFTAVEECKLLTESEVQRSFRSMFKDGQLDVEKLDRAETLLDQLRPESPLRHRLTTELEELRELQTSKS